MFSSISNAISRIFDLVASTADSAESGLDIVNHWVGENHKAQSRIITKNAQERVAKHHARLEKELNADESLAKHFKEIEEDW